MNCCNFVTRKNENDVFVFHISSPVAALPRTDAIRLLPAGAVCRDGGICGDGMELL